MQEEPGEGSWHIRMEKLQGVVLFCGNGPRDMELPATRRVMPGRGKVPNEVELGEQN